MLNRIGLHYPMPSFLPLKFHNFAAGIVMAHLFLRRESLKSLIFIILTILLALYFGNKSIYVPLLFLFGVWWVCGVNSNQNRVALLIHGIFQSKFTKFLSEISYSLYIFHLVLMLPFFAFFLAGGKLSPMRWASLSILLLLLTLCVSYLIYRYIEIPGINWGKKLVNLPARMGGSSDSSGPRFSA